MNTLSFTFKMWSGSRRPKSSSTTGKQNFKYGNIARTLWFSSFIVKFELNCQRCTKNNNTGNKRSCKWYFFCFVLLQGPETPVWEDGHAFPGVQLDSSAGGPRHGLCPSWGRLHLPPGLWGAHTWTGGHSWTQKHIRLIKINVKLLFFSPSRVFSSLCWFVFRLEIGTRSCRPPESCPGRTCLNACWGRGPYSRYCLPGFVSHCVTQVVATSFFNPVLAMGDHYLHYPFYNWYKVKTIRARAFIIFASESWGFFCVCLVKFDGKKNTFPFFIYLFLIYDTISTLIMYYGLLILYIYNYYIDILSFSLGWTDFRDMKHLKILKEMTSQ